MTLNSIKQNILQLKNGIQDSVNDNESCDEFLLSTLGKSREKISQDEYSLWIFAFENALKWNKVEEQFKNCILND